MRKSITLVFFCLFSLSALTAQEEEIDFLSERCNWNNGLSISPQMLFVGGLDLGLYSNVEYRPFGNSLATLVGIDVRNKWLQLNVSNSGLDTRSIKTVYSVNIITYAGLGYSAQSKEEELNSFYLTATPYIFAFKERVETPFIRNTVRNSSFNINAGLTWSNIRITKKGRRINTQFYLPIFGRHLLDELRIMNLKVGISI